MILHKIKSYAKINLALNITGKTNSLHNIESIIAFISLHDEIFIKKTKSTQHKILFTGKFSKNIKKNNTISKLLYLLDCKKLLNNKKFFIKINKNIPNKAGLGGGSMNAANLLKYFIKRKIVKINKKEIIETLKLIGSDAVLGLRSNNLILTSQSKIRYFANNLKMHILIVKPNFGCSTKYIYSKVTKLNKSMISKPSKKMFSYDNLKRMNNSLEPIVLNKYAKLKGIKFFLENFTKPIFVRMTGSGSALVAYFQSKKKCNNAMKQFCKKYKNYWCIASKTI